jgi:hypothetical protein
MDNVPAAETPDDVEQTDQALKEDDVLGKVIYETDEYLDEQRVEESEVAEQDPADAGPILEAEDAL